MLADVWSVGLGTIDRIFDSSVSSCLSNIL